MSASTSSGSLEVRHRVLATIALLSLVAAVVLVAVGVQGHVLLVAGLALALAISTMAAWVAATRRGPVRGAAAAVATLLVLGVVIVLLVTAEWWRLAMIGTLIVVSVASARDALGVDGRTLTGAPPPGTPVGPAARGTLIMNLRSGGGKAEQFDLVSACRARGVEPIVLGPDDDLEQLARKAVADGADVIGMAGGDGSQALVASVAAELGVAFVCIPAGTRNHFALDLGLDREDVVGALDAYDHALERWIDLATINGRTFVNNVSLGVYAEVVQSDDYRDAKVATTLQRLPELLGPTAEPFDLRFTGPDGEQHETAHIIQVSNNSYELHSFTGVGSRPRLDQGVLGIVAIHIDRATDVPELLTLIQAGQVQRFRGFHEWQARTFRVDSSNPIAAGVDGEALSFESPLELAIEPGALHVRVPLHAPGWAPAALAQARGRFTVVDLLRVAAGRAARRAPLPSIAGDPDAPERAS